jgi:hypothetical protein
MKWIAGIVIWGLGALMYSYVGGEEKIVVLAGWLLVALLISTACIIGYLVRIIDLLEKNSDNERAAQERLTIAKETIKISMPTVKAVSKPLPQATRDERDADNERAMKERPAPHKTDIIDGAFKKNK